MTDKGCDGANQIQICL